MKKTVYLDATIPSYLFDERESIREYITGGTRKAGISTSMCPKKRSLN